VISISDFTYTLEDFDTTTPYEALTSIKDPFEQHMSEKRLGEYAKSIGYKGFRTALLEYRKSLKRAADNTSMTLTQFDEQDIELNTGEWQANDFGIWKPGANGTFEIACSHPIMPVELLRNIDTGELKVRLAFRRGANNRKVWNEILVSFDSVADSKGVVKLASIGISVNAGKRAQNLSDYIRDVLDLNFDRIPQRKSVSKMGWNEEGFSPYVSDITFDGNDDFRRAFNAIRPHGDYDAWRAEAVDVRRNSVAAKLILAASFASVLIGPLGCLPFFVHLWGMASGTGKTVAQMMAASVWADPSIGGPFVPTFKSTATGIEILAGFLNSLPVIIDELQLAKDNRGKINFNVYELASGSGKLRSNKTLGLAPTRTWANCFITSGETPLVGENDGAGALNRVIEIECKEEMKVIADGRKTADLVKTNYGHAGKEFVEFLSTAKGMAMAQSLYQEFFDDCMRNNTTSKQAMAAALILVADSITTDLIFGDNNGLSVDDVAEFLKTAEAVSAADRGYNYMCDWVSQNVNKLNGRSEVGEVYGRLGDEGDPSEKGYVFIVRAVFNRACQDAGISAPALLSQLRSRNLIQTRGRKLTVAKRISGIPTECVALKLMDDPDDWIVKAEQAEVSEWQIP